MRQLARCASPVAVCRRHCAIDNIDRDCDGTAANGESCGSLVGARERGAGTWASHVCAAGNVSNALCVVPVRAHTPVFLGVAGTPPALLVPACCRPAAHHWLPMHPTPPPPHRRQANDPALGPARHHRRQLQVAEALVRGVPGGVKPKSGRQGTYLTGPRHHAVVAWVPACNWSVTPLFTARLPSRFGQKFEALKVGRAGSAPDAVGCLSAPTLQRLRAQSLMHKRCSAGLAVSMARCCCCSALTQVNTIYTQPVTCSSDSAPDAQCPPWPHMSVAMTGQEAAPAVTGGLFPHPPDPSEFASLVSSLCVPSHELRG